MLLHSALQAVSLSRAVDLSSVKPPVVAWNAPTSTVTVGTTRKTVRYTRNGSSQARADGELGPARSLRSTAPVRV